MASAYHVTWIGSRGTLRHAARISFRVGFLFSSKRSLSSFMFRISR